MVISETRLHHNHYLARSHSQQDARLDNRKAKAVFGGKVRMLDLGEVEAVTGHPVGGVCPFGLATPLPVYCDVSLQAFDEVVPAAGGTHSSVRIAWSRSTRASSASKSSERVRSALGKPC